MATRTWDSKSRGGQLVVKLHHWDAGQFVVVRNRLLAGDWLCLARPELCGVLLSVVQTCLGVIGSICFLLNISACFHQLIEGFGIFQKEAVFEHPLIVASQCIERISPGTMVSPL